MNPGHKKEKKRFHRISVHEMMKSSQITFTMSSDLYVLPMFNTKKTSSVSHLYRHKHTPPQITPPPLDTPTSASRGIRLLPSTVGKQSLVQTNITTTNITYRSTLNFYCPYFWYPPTPHGPHGSCVLYGICKCFTSFCEFISRTIIAYIFLPITWDPAGKRCIMTVT